MANEEAVQAGNFLRDVLERYREWLKREAPNTARGLNKGLGASEIQRVVAGWDVPLPEDLFALFEIFNGQRGEKLALLPCPIAHTPGLRLARLEDMEAWNNAFGGEIYLFKNLGWYKSYQASPQIRSEFWLDGWLPFADVRMEREGLYLTLFIDLQPAPEGKVGQVVLNMRRVEDGRMHLERRVLAASLAEYFTDVIALMASGSVAIDSKYGIAWPAR
ncbi:MAG: SMI1/KNR4 family protein [Dokdonella sp.]